MIIIYFLVSFIPAGIFIVVFKGILGIKIDKNGDEIINYIKEHYPEDWVRLGRPYKCGSSFMWNLAPDFRSIFFEDMDTDKKPRSHSFLRFLNQKQRERSRFVDEFWRFTAKISEQDQSLSALILKDKKNLEFYNRAGLMGLVLAIVLATSYFLFESI